MRVMGLDFGSKTVGVAISDPLFVTAQESKSSEEKKRISCAIRCSELKN